MSRGKKDFYRKDEFKIPNHTRKKEQPQQDKGHTVASTRPPGKEKNTQKTNRPILVKETVKLKCLVIILSCFKSR